MNYKINKIVVIVICILTLLTYGSISTLFDRFFPEKDNKNSLPSVVAKEINTPDTIPPNENQRRD